MEIDDGDDDDDDKYPDDDDDESDDVQQGIMDNMLVHGFCFIKKIKPSSGWFVWD